MGQESTGLWLNQYVAPQLLQEFKNYKDDFIGVIPGVNKSAITADGIRFNKLINNVGFYVNNTLPFTPKKMNGVKIFVPWEKYDTDPTEVDDAEVRALAFDKRNEVRGKHTESFKMGIRDHVMWKLCPEDNTNQYMPVVRTTGDVINGRRRMRFADLVTYLEKVKDLHLPLTDKIYMILNNEHTTDLIIDRDSAKLFADKNVYVDEQTGKVRNIMGFKFFENTACPAFSADSEKLAKGAILSNGDQRASMFFYAPNALYHLESTKILYRSELIDTRSADPASEFRTQTYGLVDRIVDYGFGAIVSANQ